MVLSTTSVSTSIRVAVGSGFSSLLSNFLTILGPPEESLVSVASPSELLSLGAVFVSADPPGGSPAGPVLFHGAAGNAVPGKPPVPGHHRPPSDEGVFHEHQDVPPGRKAEDTGPERSAGEAGAGRKAGEACAGEN